MTTVRLGPPSPADIAAQAKAWRRANGLSQTAAAENLGIPTRTWQHMEQGRAFPYPALLQVAFKHVTLRGDHG